MSRKRKPRDPTEAHEWLKQIAGNLRDVQAKPDEIPLNVDLANWFADAVDDYTLKKLTEKKHRVASMDVALGLKRPVGRQRGTDMGGLGTAIEAHSRRLRKETLEKISERRGIGVRSLQRTSRRHADGVAEHLWQHSERSVPFGYDLKDGKLVTNEREAAIVRMIFERYAQLGSAPAPKRALAALMLELKAEGITDKRGKPIDIDKVITNRVYIGEVVHKGMYDGEHEAIIDRALWLKVHRIHRVVR